MRDESIVHAPDRARRVPKSMLAAPLLLGLLVFHFIAVGLHVCPPNLVSVAARPWVDAYIHPYFTQRWELFAPDPGGINRAVHIRCHRVAADGPVATDWIDVTAPLVAAHQRNRFGAAGRVLRAANPRLTIDQVLERRAVETMDGELAEQALEVLDERARRVFERGKAHAQRVASAECKRRFGSEIEQVEVRVVISRVAPYGQRHAPPPQTPTAIALPPMPYVEVSL